MQLYSYFRSSASYRVRIALGAEGPGLRLRAGAPASRTSSSRAAFAALAPAQLVPLLEGRRRGADAVARDHRVPRRDASRAAAAAAATRSAAPACARSRWTSPARSIRSNNLRVLRYLRARDEASPRTTRTAGTGTGSRPASRRSSASSPAAPRPAASATATRPTLADCVLVPQIFNAQRIDCRLDHVPTVMRVFDACMQLDAFATTQPSACPDAA